MSLMPQPPDDEPEVPEGPDDLARYIADRERREPGFAALVREAEQRLLLEDVQRRRGLLPPEEDDDD